MSDLVYFLLGIVLAGLGGELFIRSTVSLAGYLRISPSIIGATVAAFATSSPELSVGITSAIAGTPQIVLGNCLGANILNIALVLGIALLIGGIRISQGSIGYNVTVAFITPVIIGGLAIDGILSRLDGILLLCLFLVWIALVISQARRQRSIMPTVPGEQRIWFTVSFLITALILLIAGGRLVVIGASGIAALLGLNGFVVGAILVALGTTTPELATTVVCKLRGHGEVGLNTIVGSIVFNGLLIIGTASIISPISLEWGEVSLALLFGVATLAVALSGRRTYIPRWRGPILIGMFIAYLIATLQR